MIRNNVIKALAAAKAHKITVLKTALSDFRKEGFTFQGVLTAPAVFNLSENSARYADTKSSRRLGGNDKFKFYDQAIPRVKHNFVDEAGFDLFVNEINEEEERIVEKGNQYREDVDNAETILEVDDVPTNFTA